MINYHNILITGGTGYFADHFIRHADDQFDVERLCIYSRNEMKQAERRARYEQELSNHKDLRWFIGDVRDYDRLATAMDGIDLVVHAAALKRVEVAEYNILEAIATNVTGTQNVMRAAVETGVKRVILLSTDKACRPTTTYGLTKALAEQITLRAHYYAQSAPRRPWNYQTTFGVCRYGNVIGSTGSVVPTWRRLKESGFTGVPVTDPSATRFWMTARQAVELVIMAATGTNNGKAELWTPNDLPAFSVGDLAKAMELETHLVGLPAGEKLHEEMTPGVSSEHARRMTVEEIRQGLEAIKL